MKKSSICIFLLAASILFVGCRPKIKLVNSDEVDQNIIFQNYKAVYDENSNQLTMSAVFRVDNASGQLLKLTKDAGVKANQQDMKLGDDGYYTVSSRNFLPVVEFEYVNNQQEKFVNKLTINKIEVTSNDIVLDKAQINTLEFQGKEISERESISLVLTKDKESVEIEADAEGHRVYVEPSYLSCVDAGTYSVCFVRKNYDSNISAKDRGGVWESEYHSKLVKITVK
ncbi:MAG: hypothetical protein J5642_06875 [Bacteroidales bacterium]|nr:hypothetical protein [Bacteroidales bacterium]